MSGVVAIILADRASRILVGPRQLTRHRGTTLLRAIAGEACASSCDRVAVVLGAASGLIAPTLDGAGVELIMSPHWRDGVASSIRAGVAWAEAAGADAAILCSCDRPELDAAHFDRLIGAYHASGGAVASYDGHVLGAPALWPRASFPALAALTGDLGERRLLAALDAAVVDLPVPDVAARRTA